MHWALLLFGSISALAQEPLKTSTDFVGSANTNDSVTVYALQHRWSKLRLSRSVCSLEVLDSGDVLAMACSGRIYKMSRSGTWNLSLGGSYEESEIDPEQILLDAEATIDELNSNETEEVYDEDDELIEVIPDDVADEIEQSIFDPIRDRVRGGEKSIRPPRTIYQDPKSGVVLGCRGDGCYRSPNEGKTWYPIEELPVAREFVRFKSSILAATQQGVWWTQNNGLSWRLIDTGLQSLEVRAVESLGNILLASTSEGVFLTLDGVRWAKTLPPRYADLASEDICIDIGVDGGLWLATHRGIMRSDDLMQSLYPIGQNPLTGTRQIMAWKDEVGHLFSVGADGVWESMDGGMRWSPIYDGLTARQVFDIDIWKGAPIIATEEGVFYLVPGQSKTNTNIFKQIELPTLQILLDAAQEELEGQLSSIEIQRRFLTSRRVPQISLTGEYGQDRSIGADYGAIQSIATDNTQWKVTMSACFGSCSSSSTSTAFTGDVDDLMVIDGDIYETGDAGVLPAAANILSDIVNYRQDVSSTVIDLYTTYQRLLLQAPEIAGLSLFEQTLHQLEMDEVVSRLDAVTQGTFYHILNQNILEAP